MTVRWVLALLIALAVAVGVGAWVASSGPGQQAFGKVCGVTALSGGPHFDVGVKDPALLHRCSSGPHQVSRLFSLMSNNGRLYEAYSYNNTGWSATLPAGTYRAVRRPGCPSPGPPMVVAPRKTLVGVVVWWGCLYH